MIINLMLTTNKFIVIALEIISICFFEIKIKN